MAIQRFAAASGLAAAFSLLAVPALASALPDGARTRTAYDAAAEAAHQARGWAARDGGGYYSDYGYGGPRGRDDRYDDDPGFAAPDDRQGDSNPGPRRALGLDRVADQCVSVVERERDRVNAVDGLSHDAGGWSVSGSLYDGSGFSCRIGADGQLQDVHFGRATAAPLAGSVGHAAAPKPEAAPRPELGYAAPAAPAPAVSLPAAPATETLASAPPPAAPDESAYRMAKLPPPPAIPLAAAPAAAPSLAAPGPRPAGDPQAAPPTDGSQADDDSGPLPPADTSEAHAVDPDQVPAVAGQAQPNDDGRYSASQAPDFGQSV